MADRLTGTPDPAPEGSLYRGALFVGDSHLRKREYAHAARAYARASRLAATAADRELARALVHAAAAGYKHAAGDEHGADRQLAHARRRLGPSLPGASSLSLASLLALSSVAARGEGVT